MASDRAGRLDSCRRQLPRPAGGWARNGRSRCQRLTPPARSQHVRNGGQSRAGIERRLRRLSRLLSASRSAIVDLVGYRHRPTASKAPRRRPPRERFDIRYSGQRAAARTPTVIPATSRPARPNPRNSASTPTSVAAARDPTGVGAANPVHRHGGWVDSPHGRGHAWNEPDEHRDLASTGDLHVDRRLGNAAVLRRRDARGRHCRRQHLQLLGDGAARDDAGREDPADDDHATRKPDLDRRRSA